MARARSRPARRRRRSPLEWAGSWVTRHPKLTVAIWFLALVFLAGKGSGLEEKVSSSPIFIDGSEAEREHDVALSEFDAGSAVIVMLRGPAPALDRQGPLLVERLNRLPSTSVNSPWDASRVLGGLRPEPGVASLVISVGERPGLSSGQAVQAAEREVHRTISGPVHASVAGALSLALALRESASSAATAAERLALPVLLIVLLFVCRSLIAAALPVLVGAMVVGATKGVLDLCAELMRIESFALAAAGMLGLALGVDYSLLVVSRFREEREGEGDLAAAMQRTVVATAHSVVPAGCGLVLAMLVSALLLPSAVISSVALAVTTAAVLSVFSAIFATPSILMVTAKYLDRWSLPPRRPREGGPRWTQRLSGRPAMVIAIGLVLFVCSAWAFTLQTKVGTAEELPSDDQSRIQHEAIGRDLGPGWIAPVEVLLTSEDGPVTTTKRLEALTAFQREVEADPGIKTMAGFSSIARNTEQLRRLGPGLDAQQRGIVRIDSGLARVRKGAASSGSGLTQARDGAQRIDLAIGETEQGSRQIADGLRTTARGSERLDGGLSKAGDGSGELAAGAERSSDGATRLAKELVVVRERAGESRGSSRVLRNALRSGDRSLSGLSESVRLSEGELDAAREALQRMTVGRGDPQYATALAAIEAASQELRGAGGEAEEATGVRAGIEDAEGQFSLGLYLAARLAKNGRESERGIGQLAEASQRLDRGLRRLAKSSDSLSAGIAELSAGGERLSPGLRKLTESAERLAGGLGEIGTGATALSGGLGEGVAGSGELTGALGKLEAGTGRLLGPSGKGRFAAIHEKAPGLFKSGYFFLASLDGASPGQRERAGFLVNVGDGGSTARMLLIPSDEPNSDEALATRARLRADADRLERQAHAEVLVGGITPVIIDLNTDLRELAPLARLALSIVTILILLFVTRSLVLPLLAAALNLITVSATFGILALLFNDSLLGGPGYVDTVIVPASVILIFGLAIDYEVFIFARMREEYLRTGSAELAISNGLKQTSSVVTGAALIMISVFLVFASSPLTTLRTFGIALAVAVFIDAFLIRLVIVPAAMRALGERSWWMPRWLDRLLPGGGPPAVARGEG